MKYIKYTLAVWMMVLMTVGSVVAANNGSHSNQQKLAAAVDVLNSGLLARGDLVASFPAQEGNKPILRGTFETKGSTLILPLRIYLDVDQSRLQRVLNDEEFNLVICSFRDILHDYLSQQGVDYFNFYIKMIFSNRTVSIAAAKLCGE